MNPVEIDRGHGPVVLGLPHTGLHVPDDIAAHFNARGRSLADTDWHIHKLYEQLLPDATTVRATFHRYVIDANRDPTGATLYPGQNTTGLCPVIDFENQPIYRDDQEPDAGEIERRRLAFHKPYHAALASEIDRVRNRHGLAVLYDCHSIRSVVPYLFAGTLPDFNIGTYDGTTCAPQVQDRVTAICRAASGYTTTVNGRFKGGWTTRHYGRPDDCVHAIQMELTQCSHLKAEHAPFELDADKAGQLRIHLKSVLESIETWALSQTAGRS